jgi:hypothetical protein
LRLRPQRHAFGVFGSSIVSGHLAVDKIPSVEERDCFCNIFGSEVDEVESFYKQLWHIPWHPTKPPGQRRPCIKRGEPRVRVSPFKPPPPLPPDRPGLCVLGVEDSDLGEVLIMADRGRGRGRGNSGRGD